MKGWLSGKIPRFFTNRIVVVVLIVVAIVELCGLVGVNIGQYIIEKIVSPAELKKTVTQELIYATDMKPVVGGLAIKPTQFHGLKFYMKDISLVDADCQAQCKPLIKVGQVSLFFRYLPLLFDQRLEVSELNLSRVMLMGGAKGVWKRPYPFLKEQFWSDLKKRHAKEPPISYNDTRVTLNDLLIKDNSPLEDRLMAQSITIDRIGSKNPINVRMKALLHLPNSRTQTLELAARWVGIEQIERYVFHPTDLQQSDLKLSSSDKEKLEFAYEPGGKNQPGMLKVKTSTISLLPWKTDLQQALDLFEQDKTFLDQIAVTGNIEANFKAPLDLAKTQIHWGQADGKIDLKDIIVAGQKLALEKINGRAVLSGNLIRLEDFETHLADSLIQFAGQYKFAGNDLMRGNLSARATGEQLPLAKILAQLKTMPELSKALAGQQVDGRASFDISVMGYWDGKTFTPIKSKPLYGGHATLQNGQYHHQQLGVSLSDLNAKVTLANGINLDKLTGRYEHAPFQVTGHSNLQATDYNFNVQANNVDLAPFRKLVQGLDQLKGQATVNLTVTEPMVLHGNVAVNQVAVQPKGIGEPLRIPKLNVAVQDNKIAARNVVANLGAIPFTANFKAEIPKTVQSPPMYQLAFETPQIPVAWLRDRAPQFKSILPKNLQAQYPEIWNTAGDFKVTGEASSKTKQAEVKLALNNVGVSTPSLDFPVYDLRGSVVIRQPLSGNPLPPPVLASGLIDGKYGDSALHVTARQQGNKPSDLIADVNGVLSPLLVNHLLTSPKAIYAPYNDVPFDLSLRGREGQLKLDLDHMTLEAEPTQHGPNDQVFLNTWFRLTPQMQSIEKVVANLHLTNEGDLWFEGDTGPKQTKLHVLTAPSVDIAGLSHRLRKDIFQDAKGELACDVTLTKFAALEKPATADDLVEGWLEFNSLEFPNIDIDNLTGSAMFNGKDAEFDVPSFNVPGISVSAKAKTEDSLAYPQRLTDVKIGGSMFDIASFQQFSRDIIDKVFVQQVAQKFARPWQEGDAIVPVEFRDAEVSINEVVYQNILLDSLKGKLSLNSNSFFEISDFNAKVAEGKVNGYVSMSPLDSNFTTVQLNLEDVKVNAVTRALLQVSNQIFGDLDGTIRFTTQGVTDVQQMENANGTVRMKITNGRLPAIAKIETLLTAANVIRGGILGLNLNNLMRTMAPFNTNYFAEMSGDLLIANKKLHTDNTLSDGENLDLLIQGNLGLEDGIADMVVNGKMNQNVSGKLGFLGKLSLGQVFRVIPVVGYLPGSANHGLLYRLPGVGYIPGLGGPAGEISRFRVKIQGPAQDQSSVKDFEWVAN